jgi:DNA polymerase-2
MRGMILQTAQATRQGRPLVRIFGRSEDGAPFLVEDERARPSVFVPVAELESLGSVPGVTAEVAGLRDLRHEPVARLVVEKPSDLAPLLSRLGASGVRALESDLPLASRYPIERGLLAGIEIEDDPTGEGRAGLRVFASPRFRPAQVRAPLTMLSIDIETPFDASSVWSIALVGCGVEEVHLVTDRDVQGAISHPDEDALLRNLVERIQVLDPDILTGWNVVDFDLRVISERCRRLGIRADFGRIPGEMHLTGEGGFSRQRRAVIAGRVVLDALPIARESLRMPDYRLETVAREVLGRGKRIDHDVPDPAEEIARLYREDQPALVAYNLEDARLVEEILEREGLLDLTIERSLLSGMPLDRVGASVASFDRLYLPALHARGRVAESISDRRGRARIGGGAVLASVPGLFTNVAVFDFKSLYPSLIRTFQLDPLAYAITQSEGVEDPIIAPNGARFAREGAILPELLERLGERRAEARQRGARHADRAIKIMMNAFYGVLATPACRFFEPEIANAITGFGQQILGWTRDLLEDEGLRVLYGDTDSVFVELATREVGEEAAREAGELRDLVQGRISSRIAEEYRVEPHLVLELEYVLDRFFLPRVRGGGSGSKKRYAGWRQGSLLVVGLEAVRRDWPQVSRRLQQGMLERLFTGGDVAGFVREILEGVRSGALDGELVYSKRVRKGDLSKYTKTGPPHVQAARKMPRFEGGLVRYVLTPDGPEPVLRGQPLPTGVDRRLAVEKLIRPIAESILLEMGIDFDELAGNPRQLKLL